MNLNLKCKMKSWNRYTQLNFLRVMSHHYCQILGSPPLRYNYLYLGAHSSFLQWWVGLEVWYKPPSHCKLYQALQIRCELPSLGLRRSFCKKNLFCKMPAFVFCSILFYPRSKFFRVFGLCMFSSQSRFYHQLYIKKHFTSKDKIYKQW